MQRADGVELVSNGTFNDGTTGWTAQNAAISVSSGQLTVDDSANAGSYSSANQNVTTDRGLTYLLKVEIVSTTGTPSIAVYHDGWSAQAGNVYYSTFSTVGTKYILFKNSSSTTSTISVQTSGTTSTVYDNISVTLVEGSNTGSNFTPQVGDDRKVTFEGVTKINSDAYFYLPTGDTASRYKNTSAIGNGRIVAAGGLTDDGTIDYITISSTGNAQDFGDLAFNKNRLRGTASSTRGLFMGGASEHTQIQYVTMATTGNAKDFGDSTSGSCQNTGLCSNNNRAVNFIGTNPSTNGIEFMTISTTW